MQANNMDAKVSHLRDTFLAAEKDYVNALLEDEKLKEYVEYLNIYDGHELFEAAEKLIDKIEYGEVPESELEKVEAHITLILSAIKDVVLKRELVRTPYYEDEPTLGGGRHR